MNLNIFGVRHLSPSSAYNLIEYLNKLNPKCVLIEGPSDTSDMLKSMADKRVNPPVALMSYTMELPIETILYPFARYSPEYQAIVWAIKKNLELRFIDLPTSVSLRLSQERLTEESTNKDQKKVYHEFHSSLYEQIAARFEETNYESYWERNFEHKLDEGFQESLAFQSGEIRKLVEDHEAEFDPWEHSYNLIREAYMRREIQQALNDGYEKEDIVVIVGAYHILGLREELPPMSDEEYNALPKVDTKVTLMPYSYYRLSSRTGYGAGNKAPYYFEIMWQCMQDNKLDELAANYLTLIARNLRELGNNASSASVIEAVRLSNALAALRGGKMPTLNDLHDSTVTCLGQGELSVVAEAINRADIGTSIGSLPEGLSQTPVQDDLNRELKRLKITEYKTPIAQDLLLDLRENRSVKTKEAAFIDLDRSTFFHRLSLLEINFVKKTTVSQSNASWAEKWELCWTPEVEIQIVEANLKGESIELASAYELNERLQNCETISVAADLIRIACECNLASSFHSALNVLQQLSVEAGSFNETASATRSLSLLIQYGNIRCFELKPLEPLLQQLFLRASLLLFEACVCDNNAAKEMSISINKMHLVSQELYELVNDSLWVNELRKVAELDDRNAILSGLGFAILLERNLVSEEDCAKEVSRRLSPGVPADLGAGWFEGLSGRNRYALLSRISLWQELDKYISLLDEDEFHRSVVFLRRAFGEFEPSQKNNIAELLGDLWNVGAEYTAEILQEELTETEVEKLEEINDFDFDDLF